MTSGPRETLSSSPGCELSKHTWILFSHYPHHLDTALLRTPHHVLRSASGDSQHDEGQRGEGLGQTLKVKKSRHLKNKQIRISFIEGL